jgi:hypothetical protein
MGRSGTDGASTVPDLIVSMLSRLRASFFFRLRSSFDLATAAECDAVAVAAAIVSSDVVEPRCACVRSCCFILSLRVNALPQTGQWTDFSPVCFLPCLAAWPEVVNVEVQSWDAA